ncbi:MAG: von Willebrand factor type A domain-containing protein [Hyphomicrobium sp.]|nr:von Willebrand factor type A domain-containing protein [Hyphomicrobium sp.]
MTERDLENLKTLPVPAARADAKRAAMEAALIAFDTAHSGHAPAAGVSQDKTDAPKGNIVPLRQTETSTHKRSFRMLISSRSTQALAASVAAIVIAAPFAFQHLRTDLQGPAVTVITELRSPANAPVYGLDTARQADDGRARSNAADQTIAHEDKLAKSKEDKESFAAARKTAESVAPPPPPMVSSEPPAAAPSNKAEGDMRNVAGKVTPETQKQWHMQSRLGLGTLADATSPVTLPNALPADAMIIAPEEHRDAFAAHDINPVKQVATDPVSTFSIDVDTASYAFVRRALNSGHLPPKDAVRPEEMINYFPYAYPAPESADTPFKPTVTVMPSPWNPTNKLVHIAINGYDIKSAERPRANLVFLMDVSGSMGPQDRLPLVKNALRLLVDQLKPDDTVAIVTYASGSGIALEPTKVSDKAKILTALEQLGAGGSTAGAAGIADAYRLAEAGFDKAAVNRVILATDGDFNVGITDTGELKSFIERKRQSGIFLSILGVGQGNHNDALMQTLAQNGNGTAAYVDTLSEARKVLVEDASSTLFTIAKDVKTQVEWNPARVSEYRLIGYETRALSREDFNNDRVDAGDIGSGHTVTAIYEITPAGAPTLADDLRYGSKTAPAGASSTAAPKAVSNELGFLKLRYKRPNDDTSQLISLPVTDDLAKATMNEVPVEQRFSVAVAAFAQLLKGAPYTQGYTFDDVLALAQPARGDDPFGYRAEFLNLVRLAKSAQP